MSYDEFVDPRHASTPQAPQRPGGVRPPAQASAPQPMAHPPPQVPSPPGTWAEHGVPPQIAPKSKKPRWPVVLVVVAVVGLVVGGYGLLVFRGQRAAGEIEQAGVDFFAASNRGEDLTLRLDGGEGCLQPEEIQGDEPLFDWEPTSTVYEVNSGGTTSFNVSTLDGDMIDDFRRGRPAGTDYGVSYGVLRIAGEPSTNLGIFLIREPGADWLVCAFDSGL